MPELPEVEVVKKSLNTKIKNLTIKKIIILNKRLRYKLNSNLFSKLKNKKVISINRRSKYLLIGLNNDIVILIHLGMTGKFFIIDENNKKLKTSFYYSEKSNDYKHDHVIFYFNKGIKLIYNDVRKFGFIKIYNKKTIFSSTHLVHLGPEPLTKNFNKKYFFNYIKKKEINIKDLLMSQKFVSGLGNIYCNEILFKSKINPKKKLKLLKKKDIINILSFAKKILKTSIREGGSSIKNFNSVDGKSGNFQQNFFVYGREGMPCKSKNCNSIIKKIYISKRSSFLCPRCQK